MEIYEFTSPITRVRKKQERKQHQQKIVSFLPYLVCLCFKTLTILREKQSEETSVITKLCPPVSIWRKTKIKTPTSLYATKLYVSALT